MFKLLTKEEKEKDLFVGLCFVCLESIFCGDSFNYSGISQF